MDESTRRQILLARQHITSTTDKSTVCRDLNGLQAQFLSYTRHALALRCGTLPDGNWGNGLVKSWTIRGTMHIFQAEDLPLFLHRDRTHYLREVDQFVDDEFATAERKGRFAQHILDCVDSGITTREALRDACRREGMTDQEEQSFFNSWGGLLRAMCETGMLCHSVREEKSFQRCPDFTPMDRDKARLELFRRYFTNFGPATVRDAAYYFGATQREVKAQIDRLPVDTVTCSGRDCFFIDDGQKDFPDIPDCVLLAGFDQLLLGYEKKESIFLSPEYIRGIFNLSGIVMPAVLLDGLVAGRWKVSGRKGIVTCFRPMKVREKKAIEREIHQWFPTVQSITFE